MKKNIYWIIVSLMLGSCSNYLETNFDGSVSDENVWTNPVYAEGVLLNAYEAIPDNYSVENGTFMDCATDNAVTNDYGSLIYQNANGGWRSDNNNLGQWENWYMQVEYINLWLKYGDQANYYLSDGHLNEQIKKRLTGEAHFLRAWYYFKLLQSFAGIVDGEMMGVPLYRFPLEGNIDKANKIKRSTYEEVLEFILEDCNIAIEKLPEDYDGNDHVVGETHVGRANAIAAMALKSRVLLYAASPAFSKSDWSEVARVSLELLSKTRTSLPKINWDNLDSYYNTQNHNEIIMRKFDRNNNFFKQNYPPSLNGEGRTSPSQNLVNIFFGSDGYPIDHPLSNYDPDNPYKNRSNRFNGTIAYNGSNFRGTIETYIGAFDAEGEHIFTTRTGYYLRKWMTSRAGTDEVDSSIGLHYYGLFRYGEVFLNLAESINEWVGPDVKVSFGGLSMSAKEAIIEVRRRAGIKSTEYVDEVAAMGQSEFRKLIHRERRIELCFEGHRFWDIRRWNDPLSTTISGVRITKMGEDEFQYDYPMVEQRNYSEHMRFGPIPLKQVTLGLRQNDGW
ncbi:RagB/SusD family nutrient uptake outer membrane protein [Flammeovirga agarivorans]|uniref:RagB/SusD family nutrient uptake outer membrane protein n=1 Tax=Flammeovirga agarivorans TaxID=2726742 RepID=A0A7X8XYJ5_9BACT|nr:RagB/SusD family nutrient uptake outer membrane protein [Flammeovirga agarivorans]NLR94085.1 RagB/SusD family nutrient uptake outer membrane protein [Flammeovirga agarivorans]